MPNQPNDEVAKVLGRYKSLISRIGKENSPKGKLESLLAKAGGRSDEEMVRNFLNTRVGQLEQYSCYFAELVAEATSLKGEIEDKIYSLELDIAVRDGIVPTQLLSSVRDYMVLQREFYSTIIMQSEGWVHKIDDTVKEIRGLMGSSRLAEAIRALGYMRAAEEKASEIR